MNAGTLTEAILEFPDNRLLIDLCGEFDRNLTDIETRTGVQILRRGNQLAIHGPEESQAAARDVLMALYQRLEQGRSVGRGDIDLTAVMDAMDALDYDGWVVVEQDVLNGPDVTLSDFRAQRGTDQRINREALRAWA